MDLLQNSPSLANSFETFASGVCCCGGGCSPFVPALISGSVVVQAVALDIGQSGLSIVVSNEQTLTWPAAQTVAPGQANTQSAGLASPYRASINIGGTVIIGLER